MDPIAYVDDSGSDPNDKVYMLAGVVLPAEQWSSLSKDWQRLMEMPPRLEYFKASSVGDRDKGPFKDFTGLQRREIVEKLVAALAALHPLTVSVSVSWEVFHEFRLKHALAGVFGNPYHFLYYNMIRMGAELCLKESQPMPIDFVFDEHNKIGDGVRDLYDYFKDHAPVEWIRVLGKRPAFADEKCCVPLQAADLVAWYQRRKVAGNLNPWQETIWSLLSEHHSNIEMDTDSLLAMVESFGALDAATQ